MAVVTRVIPVKMIQTPAIRNPALGIEIYKSENGKTAMGFHGRRSNPDFFYSFPSADQCNQFASDYVDSIQKRWDEKKRIKEERKNFVHSVREGDVLHSSWGYDQTNNDFYVVLKVCGKNIVFAEVDQERKYTGDMVGKTRPIVDRIVGAEMTKKVLPGNRVKINSFSSARRIEPVADQVGVYPWAYFSEYA